MSLEDLNHKLNVYLAEMIHLERPACKKDEVWKPFQRVTMRMQMLCRFFMMN